LNFKLFQARSFIDRSILVNIFKNLFNAYVYYGIEVWGNTTHKNIKTIQILQNRAIRIICRIARRSSVRKQLSQFKMLNVSQLHKFVTTNLAFKYTHGLLPKAYSDLKDINPPLRKHTRNRKTPFFVTPKNEKIKRNLIIQKAASLYSALPRKPSETTTLKSFSHELKKLILSGEFWSTFMVHSGVLIYSVCYVCIYFFITVYKTLLALVRSVPIVLLYYVHYYTLFCTPCSRLRGCILLLANNKLIDWLIKIQLAY